MADMQIVTGDDNLALVTLTRDGIAQDVSAASTVKAALVSRDRDEMYTAAISQSALTAGADWANGVVAVSIPEASTATLSFQGRALLEIECDIAAGKRTWFAPVQILRGQI